MTDAAPRWNWGAGLTAMPGGRSRRLAIRRAARVHPHGEPTGGAARSVPRVALLTSTLGSGHLRAAQAIEAAFADRCPGATVQIVDFWSLIDGRVARALRHTYLRLVDERPDIYDRIYQLDERSWRRILVDHEPLPGPLVEALTMLSAIALDEAGAALDCAAAHENRVRAAERQGGHGARRAPTSQSMRFTGDTDITGVTPFDGVLPSRLDRGSLRVACALVASLRHGGTGVAALRALGGWGWRRLARRLEARLRAFDPDVVVATQMLPAALISLIKQRRGLEVPVIGVPTDFGMHEFWRQPGIDGYCLAHASITGRPGDGDSRAQIVTGIPLMPGFRQPPCRCDARGRLGLDPETPVVLVLGGGLGLGVEAIAERLLPRARGLQVLVLTGGNTRAHVSLAPLADRYAGRLRLWAWTEHVALFLRAADVVVGKPGGLTVAEALACGRPLLATRSLRGQEGFNVRFLERHRVGGLVPEDELAARIEALVANRAELAETQQRAWSLGTRDAAERVATVALAFARARPRPVESTS